MLFRWYRRKIARRVADKMAYLNSCPNERDIILHIIAPYDYNGTVNHCSMDCWRTDCRCYRRKEDMTRKKDGFVQDVVR